MAVITQIQLRRGTAATWTANNPTLAAGEMGFETDTRKAKIGDGITAWNSLAYALTGAVGSVTSVASGTGLSGGPITTTGTLSIDTAVVATLTGTQTLTNKTLTSPVIGTIVNTGTLTLPTSTDTLVGRATTDTLTNKTLTSPIISTISNTGTLTLPTSSDTLVGRATTDTLTNKTLTSPIISTISNTGTLTLPTSSDTLVGRATTDTLTNKTLTSPALTTPAITSAYENWSVVAAAATGTINIDVLTSEVWYYTNSASANFTLNFRGNSGTTLNTALATGQSATVVFLNTNGGTAYYATSITIDGSAVTPKWSGGTAPTAGNASAVDFYSYTIVKTAVSTYSVFAGQVKFA